MSTHIKKVENVAAISVLVLLTFLLGAYVGYRGGVNHMKKQCKDLYRVAAEAGTAQDPLIANGITMPTTSEFRAAQEKCNV